MSRLTLPDVVDEEGSVDEEENEVVTTAAEVLEKVRADTQNLGLVPYPQPKTSPQPLDASLIEAMTNSEIEVHYIAYTAYAQYVGGKHAEYDAAHKIAACALKHLESKLKARAPKGKAGAPSVKSNGVYQSNEVEVIKLYAMKTMLGAHHKNYSKQASALSRIIELRKLEFEQHLRGGNLNKRGGRPSIGFNGRPTQK